MTDISKCSGVACINRRDCYRFTAKANPWRQSYISPAIRRDGSCDHFVHNRPTKGDTPNA